MYAAVRLDPSTALGVMGYKLCISILNSTVYILIISTEVRKRVAEKSRRSRTIN